MRWLAILLAAAMPVMAQDASPLWMVMGGGGEPDPVWDGLVAYYPLDGTAYDEVSETTGNWRAGVSESTNAISGTAAGLDGGASSYVDTVNASLLDGETEVTISAWVYRDVFSAYDGIVVFRSSKVLFLAHGVTAPTMSAYVYGLSGYAYQIGVDAGMVNDEWIHLALTYTPDDGVVRVYNAGVLQSGGTVQSTDVGLFDQDALFLIGFDPFNTGRKFRGQIDEVGIWNRALSSNEVYRLHDEQLIYGE
jgi:trimeric autotransporter adhesin